MRKRYLFLLTLFCLINTTSAKQISIPSVIVTSNKRTIETPSSGMKKIVTQNEIKESGMTSLSQVLSELAGLQLRDLSGSDTQATINVRGFGPNASSNTLILVNGVPLANPDLSAVSLSAIPLPMIAYIEIIAGSESVLYGDQAVGGIINIVTTTVKERDTQLGCTAGSYAEHNCYLQYQMQKPITLQTYLSHKKNHHYREHNRYEQDLLITQFMLPYPDSTFNAEMEFIKEKLQFPGALTHAQVRVNRRGANNHRDFFNNTNNFWNYKWKKELFYNWQWQTDVVLRNLNGYGVLYADFRQNRQVRFFKTQLSGLARRTLILLGLDAERDAYLLASPYGVTDEAQQKCSFFSLARFPIDTPINVSVGFRTALLDANLKGVNGFHTINRALSTTVGLSYNLSHHFKWIVRRAESFRFPKADENAATTPFNKGLRTQRGVSYEMGTHIENKRWTTDLSLFHLKLRDEIAFDPLQTPLAPFGTNRNLSPTERIGLIAAFKYATKQNQSIGGEYQYVRARLINGLYQYHRIPLVSENIFHGFLEQRINEHIKLYLETVFTGNQYPANDDGNKHKIGGYTLFHLNLRYQLKQLSATFRINNLGNKYYYFYTVLQSGQVFFYPAPGRNYVFSLQYNFY